MCGVIMVIGGLVGLGLFLYGLFTSQIRWANLGSVHRDNPLMLLAIAILLIVVGALVARDESRS